MTLGDAATKLNSRGAPAPTRAVQRATVLCILLCASACTGSVGDSAAGSDEAGGEPCEPGLCRDADVAQGDEGDDGNIGADACVACADGSVAPDATAAYDAAVEPDSAVDPDAAVEPDAEVPCGNGTCGGGESCSTCAADCGACPVTGPVVGISKSELLAIKAKINAGADPWKGHWDLIKGGGGAYRAQAIGGHVNHSNDQRAFASVNFVPAPIDVISLETKAFPAGYGKYDAVRNFRDDGTAAFTLALRYVFEDSVPAADAAVNILDEWASTLTYINPWDSPLGGNLNQHGLESTWGLAHYTRAISILWDYPGFQAIKPKVKTWLLDVFMASEQGPLFVDGTAQNGTLLGSMGAGNGGFTSLFGRLGIGLIVGGATGDTIVANAITRFKQVLRSHIYWTGDHHTKLGAPWPYEPSNNVHLDQALGQAGFWYFGNVSLAVGPPVGFFNGLTQEAGRDFGHNQMSMGPWTYFIRTAQLNGRDLWTETSGFPGGVDRIKAAINTMAGWYNETLDRAWAASDPGDGHGTFGGSMTAIEASTWTPTGVGYGTVDFAAHNISSTNISAWSGPPADSSAASNLNIGGGSADYGWYVAHQELVVRRGMSMPQLDRLVKRLRNPGGARSKDNQAGFGRLTAGNAMAWEPLLFTEP